MFLGVFRFAKKVENIDLGRESLYFIHLLGNIHAVCAGSDWAN